MIVLVVQEGNHVFNLVIQDLFDYPELHLHTVYSCVFCGFPKLDCEYKIHQTEVDTCAYPLEESDFQTAIEMVGLNGGTRWCDCSGRKVSCLSEQEWLAKMVGVRRYSYSSIDDQFRRHHPAVMPLKMAEDLIETFSHKGEWVVDPFCGTGTTVAAAERLGRNGIGFDINPRFISIARNRVGQGYLLPIDARKGWKLLKRLSLSLILTSPPYSNILSKPQTERSRQNRSEVFKKKAYSDNPEDLGNMDRISCIESIVEVIGNFVPFLKARGHVVINVPDYFYDRSSKKLLPFSSLLVDGLEKGGLAFKNKIIWDRTHFFLTGNRPNYGMFGYPSNFLVLSGSYEVILDFEKAE